jgi:hypothetical protein
MGDRTFCCDKEDAQKLIAWSEAISSWVKGDIDRLPVSVDELHDMGGHELVRHSCGLMRLFFDRLLPRLLLLEALYF